MLHICWATLLANKLHSDVVRLDALHVSDQACMRTSSHRTLASNCSSVPSLSQASILKWHEQKKLSQQLNLHGMDDVQFQDSSGGPLQLPPIDDTTLQGLQDLLPPGKDVCDFS